MKNETTFFLLFRLIHTRKSLTVTLQTMKAKFSLRHVPLDPLAPLTVEKYKHGNCYVRRLF